MIKKVIFIAWALFTCLSSSSQDLPWRVTPMVTTSDEVSFLPGNISYFSEGEFIGEIDLQKGKMGSIKTPFDAFVRYFNVKTLEDFSKITLDKEKIAEYPQEQLEAVIKQREKGSKVFVESILEMETKNGEKIAIVKFFIEVKSRQYPIFGVKVFQKESDGWLLRIVNPVADFSFSFLSCRTISFLDVLNKQDNTYGFFSKGGVDIYSFTKKIKEWIEDPERYRKEHSFFIQNLGWK